LLMAMAGLAPEDDDGNAASETATKKTAVTVNKPPQKPAQAVQHRQPSQTKAAEKAPDSNGVPPSADDAAKSPAFKRFMAEGTKTYGKLWDDGRHWLIERYTGRMTPDNVRTSANDLSDDELDVLADALVEKRGYYQNEFQKATATADK